MNEDDDDTDAQLHQLELEERQYMEEWEREYGYWLRLQYEWWVHQDQNKDWIKEMSGE